MVLFKPLIALHEARSLIKADIRFRKWCTDNEFGPDVLNAHDRAALIAMGADPKRMRSMLTNSERQSVRYIYQHEWSAAESAGAMLVLTLPMPMPMLAVLMLVLMLVLVLVLMRDADAGAGADAGPRCRCRCRC